MLHPLARTAGSALTAEHDFGVGAPCSGGVTSATMVSARPVSTPSLEFWFEFASTYSYPAAARITGAARDARIRIVWRPFLLGPIFASQGWRDSPFNIYPAKGRYMWRD